MAEQDAGVAYPEDLAMHNPSAAYDVSADHIMVQNPVAGLANDSAELPNLTQHVPVEAVRPAVSADASQE